MTHRRLMGVTAIVAGLMILFVCGIWFMEQRSHEKGIDTYAQCVAAGNPVIESYPSKCQSSNGQTFENPTDRARLDAQQNAIKAAESYDPGGKVCTQALVPAYHPESGAYYTFPSGCLAPGWEPAR